jgi:hypothetical protein
VQVMRRQMAKLNHRLIGLELENQQQNQRWQVRYPPPPPLTPTQSKIFLLNLYSVGTFLAHSSTRCVVDPDP